MTVVVSYSLSSELEVSKFFWTVLASTVMVDGCHDFFQKTLVGCSWLEQASMVIPPVFLMMVEMLSHSSAASSSVCSNKSSSGLKSEVFLVIV